MKISLRAAVCAAMTAILALAPTRAHSQSATSPSVPVGFLSTGTGVVKAGSKTSLKWNITYPSTVVNFVTVSTSTVTPKQVLDYQVRVLGAGVTSSSSNGSNLTFVPTEAQMSVAGGTYQRIFYGTNSDVDSSRTLASGTLQAGQSLRFGGRYYYNKGWSQLYTSSSGTLNVRTLVNGQAPPTTYPLHTAPSLESFLKPYLDASGKVMIGPMDVIVFMELTHTDSQSSHQGYDLQDMVLLVTFKPKN
jgi:hypothetical protein